jgi:hypothetical protein
MAYIAEATPLVTGVLGTGRASVKGSLGSRFAKVEERITSVYGPVAISCIVHIRVVIRAETRCGSVDEMEIDVIWRVYRPVVCPEPVFVIVVIPPVPPADYPYFRPVSVVISDVPYLVGGKAAIIGFPEAADVDGSGDSGIGAGIVGSFSITMVSVIARHRSRRVRCSRGDYPGRRQDRHGEDDSYAPADN